MRRAAKRTLGAGLGAGAVAGVMFAVWRAYRRHVPEPEAGGAWEAAPFPFPPVPRPRPQSAVSVDSATSATPGAPVAPRLEPFVEPVDGDCPDSHPVKGKLTSGIYHVPGGLNYARTRPDRCYVDAAAAESDGLRPAKR